MKYYKSNPKLRAFAQKLRKTMTPEELKIWLCFLKTYKPQFKRQAVIDSYIADFYCPQAKLVIELDGSQHYTKDGEEHDKARTEIINTRGISVLRIPNNQVKEHFQEVCQQIDNEVKSQLIKLF